VYFQSEVASSTMSSRQLDKNPVAPNPRAAAKGPGEGRWHLLVIIELESAPGRSAMRGMGRYMREDRECRVAHVRLDKDTTWIGQAKRLRPGAIIARISDHALVEALHETGLPVVDIGGDDAIFHTVYDLDERYQILGRWALEGGRMQYRAAGTVGRWLGVYDDQKRLMIAICFNHDVGDAWEWADEPRYPEKLSALGIRLGVNYVVYSMTH